MTVPPRETAISAAVWELPYRFDESECIRACAVAFAPAVHVAAELLPVVGPHVVQWPVELVGFMPATAGFALALCCTCPFEVVVELAFVELEECSRPFELAFELAWVELVWVELEDVVSCFACPGATWSEAGATETVTSACASTWAAG